MGFHDDGPLGVILHAGNPGGLVVKKLNIRKVGPATGLERPIFPGGAAICAEDHLIAIASGPHQGAACRDVIYLAVGWRTHELPGYSAIICLKQTAIESTEPATVLVGEVDGIQA